VLQATANGGPRLSARVLSRTSKGLRHYHRQVGTQTIRVLADFAVARLDRRIGILGVLIGETAVGLGLPLHTFNVRHFQAIPGLRVVEPYLRSK
jgi:predicted nucleic acid-binding protein